MQYLIHTLRENAVEALFNPQATCSNQTFYDETDTSTIFYKLLQKADVALRRKCDRYKNVNFEYKQKSFSCVSMNNIYKKPIGEIFCRVLHNLISVSVMLLEIDEYLFEFEMFNIMIFELFKQARKIKN